MTTTYTVLIKLQRKGHREEKGIRKAVDEKKQKETMTEDDRWNQSPEKKRKNIQTGCEGQRKGELNK